MPVYSCQALIVSGFFALKDDFRIQWLQLPTCLFGKMTLNQVAMTDQSDAWVILALTGPLVYRTLERILPN